MTLLLNMSPYGRWQPLGCQWCSRKPQCGRRPHPHSTGFILRTFSLLPLTPKITRSSGRKRLWLWAGYYRLRHQRPRQAFSARLPGSISSAWPLWWPLMRMMLWRPPYWGLWKRNQDPPLLQKRWQPSWAKEMGHQECQTLPLDVQKSPGS